MLDLGFPLRLRVVALSIPPTSRGHDDASKELVLQDFSGGTTHYIIKTCSPQRTPQPVSEILADATVPDWSER